MTTDPMVQRMYFNLRNGLLNYRPHCNAKVGAYNMHDANDGQILAMVDYYVRVLENKERLNKYENNTREHRDQSDDK